MIKKVNHIGVAVNSISETFEIFSNVFGFEANGNPVDVREGKFRTLNISAGDASLELIEPMGSDGSIARYIQKRGNGIHHISLQVDNIDKELMALMAKGVHLINEKPVIMDPVKVAFVHPDSTSNILIELSQRMR